MRPSDRVNRAELMKLLAKEEAELESTEPTMKALLELSEKRELMRKRIAVIRSMLMRTENRFRMQEIP